MWPAYKATTPSIRIGRHPISTLARRIFAAISSMPGPVSDGMACLTAKPRPPFGSNNTQDLLSIGTSSRRSYYAQNGMHVCIPIFMHQGLWKAEQRCLVMMRKYSSWHVDKSFSSSGTERSPLLYTHMPSLLPPSWRAKEILDHCLEPARIKLRRPRKGRSNSSDTSRLTSW